MHPEGPVNSYNCQLIFFHIVFNFYTNFASWFIRGSRKSSSRANLRSLMTSTSLGEFVIIHGSKHQGFDDVCIYLSCEWPLQPTFILHSAFRRNAYLCGFQCVWHSNRGKTQTTEIYFDDQNTAKNSYTVLEFAICHILISKPSIK